MKTFTIFLLLTLIVVVLALSTSKESGDFWVTFGCDSIGIFNSNGSLQKTITAYGLSSPRGIVFAPNSKVYISSAYSDEIFIFDYEGHFINKFSHEEIDYPTGLAINNRDELYICSFHKDQIVVFDLKASFLRTFSAPTLNGPNDIVLDSHGAIYVTSHINSHIIKFDKNENYLFAFTSAHLVIPISIAKNRDDIIYVVGANSRNVIKFDTLGNYLASFGQDSIFDPHGIAFKDNGHYLVTGFWQPEHRILEYNQNDDFVKMLNVESWQSPLYIAFQPPDSVVLVQSRNKNMYPHLQQNYPNPFNPKTTIKYQIPELSFVIIKVFDVLGNEIVTLVDEENPTGSYEVEFDAMGLPSGIYFYRLQVVPTGRQAGSFVETKKMILLE